MDTKDAVCRSDHFAIMRDENEAFASLTTGARQQLGDLARIVVIEIACRFVSENDGRVVGKSSGDCNTLLFAAA